MALNIISNVQLDMKAPNTVIVYANQYDSAGSVRAQLLNSGESWAVPAGAKAVVMFKKSDNIGGFYDVTEFGIAAVEIDSDRSIIYINYDPQVLTTAGQVAVQINFYQNDQRLSSFAFYTDVQASAVTSGEVASSWLFNILSQEIAQTLTVATTPQAMTDWLEANITQETGYVIDNTLTVAGAASDAQATGKMVTVSNLNPNIVANKVWVKKTPSTLEIPTMEDVDELKGALDDSMLVLEDSILNDVDLLPFVTDTGIINSDGSESTNSNYRITAYLPVSKGTVIIYTGYAKSGANILSFYSGASPEKYVSGIEGNGASSSRNGTFTVPYTGYIRICCAYANIGKCRFMLSAALTNVKNEIEKIPDLRETLYDNVQVAECGYKRQDILNVIRKVGSITSEGAANDGYEGYLYSDYIRVLEGFKIIYKLKAAASVNIVSFYTDNVESAYYDGIAGTGSSFVVSEYLVPSDGYIRLCDKDSDIGESYVFIETPLLSKLSEIDTNKAEISRLWKLSDNIDLKPYMVISDTITSSGTFNYNANYVRSDFMYAPKGTAISVENVKCSTSYLAIAFYSEPNESSFQDGVAGNGVAASARLDYVYTTPSDGYIVVGSQSGGLNGSSFIYKSVLKQKIDELSPDATADEIIASLVEDGRKTILDHNNERRCLTFTLITDTHMYEEAINFACRNNVRLFAEMAKYTDFAVHCGDVAESGNMTSTGLTTDTYVDRDTHWNNYCEFIGLVNGIKTPLYICHGNHDVSRYNKDVVPGSNAIFAQTWSIESKRLAGNVICNSADPFSNYYYVDLDEFKCRIIVSDYFNGVENGYPISDQGMNSTEKAWMKRTAFDLSGKDAPSDWTILMFNHAKQISSIADKINAIRTANDPNSFIFIHGNDHVDNYTNDVFSTSPSAQEYAGTYFNDIGVDKGFVKAWLGPEGGTIGTATEYCVDVFCIDFNDGIIYETRLGRGEDRKYKFGKANTSEVNNIIEEG